MIQTARIAHRGVHPLAAVALAAVMSSACAAAPIPGQETPVECAGAQLHGELVADPRRSGIGVRLMGRVYPLVLPEEYSVALMDGVLSIAESSGAVVAVEGDAVEAGGGHGSAPEEEFYVCAGTLRRVR